MKKYDALLNNIFRSRGRFMHLKVTWLPDLMVHACNLSYSGGRDQKDCDLRLSQGKKLTRPYLGNTLHKKRAGGVARVGEHLPSKHEALISNPSAANLNF
jgi:hypothetical protein